jgi:hypothetical protein
MPDVIDAVPSNRCPDCGKECCQCTVCSKAKAHSGLCAKCFRKREDAKK